MAVLAHVPDLDRHRARRLRGPLTAAGGVGLATAALLLRDPHRHGSWGLCPFKAVTGWDCPLCGGLRAVNDLGHGRLVDAAHSNLLFVASVPVILALWVLWLRRGWTGSTRHLAGRFTRPLTLGYAVLLVVFTVYRNTPWGSAWYAD
jgi:hypothetical protein